MNRWTELHRRVLADAARAVLNVNVDSRAFDVYADQRLALHPPLALPAPEVRA